MFVGAWWAIFIIGGLLVTVVGFGTVIGSYRHYEQNRKIALEGKECNNGLVFNIRQWVTYSRNRGRNNATYHYAANVQYVARTGDNNFLVSTVEYSLSRPRFNQLYMSSVPTGGVLANSPLRYMENDLTKFLLQDDLPPFQNSANCFQYVTNYWCMNTLGLFLFVIVGLGLIVIGFTIVQQASVGGGIVALLLGLLGGSLIGIFVMPTCCQREMLPQPKAVQVQPCAMDMQAPPLPVANLVVQPNPGQTIIPMTQPYAANQMQMQVQMQGMYPNNQYMPQQYMQQQPMQQQPMMMQQQPMMMQQQPMQQQPMQQQPMMMQQQPMQQQQPMMQQQPMQQQPMQQQPMSQEPI